jgi:hypothetical protein
MRQFPGLYDDTVRGPSPKTGRLLLRDCSPPSVYRPSPRNCVLLLVVSTCRIGESQLELSNTRCFSARSGRVQLAASILGPCCAGRKARDPPPFYHSTTHPE